MSDDPKKAEFILAMAKHLPPSPSTLQFVDLNGESGSALARLRADLRPLPMALDAEWPVEPGSADAITGYNVPVSSGVLDAALAALRPGGRLILVDSGRTPDAHYVKLLERAGFVRILVEPALSDGDGLLMRGEKPHVTADTLERIRQVAARDEGLIDFATYTGRYVYLLIKQSPAKPLWKLQPGEVLRWEAVALAGQGQPVLLAFSGLPRAVSFMQPAVLAGKVKDVSKVGKFSRATAQGWELPALMNPPVDVLDGQPLVFVPVDPATAEAAGE